MQRFQDKTKAMFIKFTVIPMLTLCLALGIGLLFFIFSLSKYNVNKSSLDTLNQVQVILKSYDDEMKSSTNNNRMQDFVRNKRNRNEIFESFYSFNGSQKVKSQLTIYNLDEKILSSATSDDELPRFLPHLVKKKMLQNKNKMIVENNFLSPATFTIGRAILDDNQDVIGFSLYTLDDIQLQDLLLSFKTSALVITDDFDNILFTSENYLKDVIGKIKTRQDGTGVIKIDNVSYYQKVQNDENYKIRVYGIIKQPPYALYSLAYLTMICIINLMVYFFISFLADKVAATNAKSVNALVSSLDNARTGQLHEMVHIHTGDEFEYLANKYNEMLRELNQVILNNEELTHIQQQNEIKFLQNQFNPHFLFNMLETIKYTMQQDIQEASEIIIVLSKLLRYSINQADLFSDLKTDMENVELYLALHKFRYKDRLQYEISIDVNLYEEKIPRLLIQPIVENALKYGYLSKMELGIKICVYEEKGSIYFEITDDGDGISTEKLGEIQKNLNQSEEATIGIGLTLIDRKIKILYGNHFGLNVESEQKKGTIVTVNIPRGRYSNV